MDRLAELRERRALTLRELSEMSGVAADTINQIELGHRKPRPSTLRKLARALEVDVKEFYAEPILAGKAEAPQETGQPEEEMSAHDIARAAALRVFEKDTKGFRRTIASEGIDHATRISDVYAPAAYDALRRKDPEELAGTLLDAALNVAHLEHDAAGLRERITQLERENAQLRADAERESVRR
jgi:transcriptional regulator with XRE-family HTH domain